MFAHYNTFHFGTYTFLWICEYTFPRLNEVATSFLFHDLLKRRHLWISPDYVQVIYNGVCMYRWHLTRVYWKFQRKANLSAKGFKIYLASNIVSFKWQNVDRGRHGYLLQQYHSVEILICKLPVKVQACRSNLIPLSAQSVFPFSTVVRWRISEWLLFKQVLSVEALYQF